LSFGTGFEKNPELEQFIDKMIKDKKIRVIGGVMDVGVRIHYFDENGSDYCNISYMSLDEFKEFADRIGIKY
jgi:hypothetical protein